MARLPNGTPQEAGWHAPGAIGGGNDRVRSILGASGAATPTLPNLALIGIAVALGEETLFRAAIQPVAGILVAAILFTLAHSVIADLRHLTPGKLAYVALAFGMGVLLGVLYDRFGIAASMGTHAAFDFAALLVVRPLLPNRTGSTPS